MSIILEGIDLPKDGNEVFIIIKPNGEVRDYHNILLTNAQAVEIPTPHGRLIDADKIFTYSHWEEQAVSEAPTILEAEE